MRTSRLRRRRAWTASSTGAFVTLAAIAILVSGAVARAAQEQPPFDAEAELATWVHLWRTYDLAGLDELFVTDERLTYLSSEREGMFSGIEALREHHAGMGFVDGGAQPSGELWVSDVRGAAFGSTAVVTAIWYFGDRSAAPEQVQRGPMSAVYVWSGDRYRIAHMHFADYESPEPVHVVLATDLGEIVVAVDVARAPVTAENFLRYLDAGLYDGGTFYRTVRADNQPDDEIKIDVIQGGMNRDRRDEAWDAIPMEPTDETGLIHLDGTISMARSGPDTARAEFFICIGDQPELDHQGRRNPDGYGFAAFGRVVAGMDVVRRIHAGAAERQRLQPAVTIRRAHRTTGS